MTDKYLRSKWDSLDPTEKMQAIGDALHRCVPGLPAPDFLFLAVMDPDPDIRAEAYRVVAVARDDRFRPLALMAAMDPSDYAADTATAALASLLDTRAVDFAYLIVRRKDAPDWAKAGALQGLAPIAGAIGAERALRQCIEGIARGDYPESVRVAAAAILVLGGINPPEDIRDAALDEAELIIQGYINQTWPDLFRFIRPGGIVTAKEP